MSGAVIANGQPTIELHIKTEPNTLANKFSGIVAPKPSLSTAKKFTLNLMQESDVLTFCEKSQY